MDLRTTLINNINISARGSFSLYGYNSKGSPVGTLFYNQLDANGNPMHKLMRLTNFSVSLDFDLGRLISGNKEKNGQAAAQEGSRPQTSAMGQEEGMNGMQQGTNQAAKLYDEYGYYIFDVPWSMRVSYNINYSKPAFLSVLTQTLSASGNVTLTKKTAITYTTGYDFTHKEITMTQIGITRDLHCWTMSFTWVPNGTMKMWNFSLRVKAAVLSDLKYERRKDYHDQF
jgi:uncharacterized Rmd1/YagE family protein